jgi:nudix-type nucleoside diphosphatase (YffH/AdpP family)
MRTVVVHAAKRIFDGFFKIEEAEVSFERYDGTMSPLVRRLCLERGDSAAVLVYNRDSAKAVFVEQFRYPTYERGPGWLIETVAGVVEPGEQPEATARREVLEEIGYEVRILDLIASFYLTPGGSSERIILFYAEVTDGDMITQGGGVASENEDIRIVELSHDELNDLYRSGGIHDAKTLVAVQWLRDRIATSTRP